MLPDFSTLQERADEILKDKELARIIVRKWLLLHGFILQFIGFNIYNDCKTSEPVPEHDPVFL